MENKFYWTQIALLRLNVSEVDICTSLANSTISGHNACMCTWLFFQLSYNNFMWLSNVEVSLWHCCQNTLLSLGFRLQASGMGLFYLHVAFWMWMPWSLTALPLWPSSHWYPIPLNHHIAEILWGIPLWLHHVQTYYGQSTFIMWRSSKCSTKQKEGLLFFGHFHEFTVTAPVTVPLDSLFITYRGSRSCSCKFILSRRNQLEPCPDQKVALTLGQAIIRPIPWKMSQGDTNSQSDD